MTITYSNGLYRVSATKEEHEMPKALGFRWNKKGQCWATNDVGVALGLIAYADQVAKDSIAGEQRTAAASVRLSSSTDTHEEFPCPAGLQYMPFQKAGIAYCLKRMHTLIADEMGLGKTITALGVANTIHAQSILIVCPASLKINWQREAAKWLLGNPGISVIEGKALKGTIGPVVVTNYERVTKSGLDPSQVWDLIIYDEAHYLKNPKAARTKAALALRGDKVLFLTGTPVINRPMDLHTILKAAKVPWAKSRSAYGLRYCEAEYTTWGLNTDGASNLEELGEKLRGSIMVRRMKVDVLDDLPGKARQIVVLSSLGVVADVEAEASAYERWELETGEARQTLAELRSQGATGTSGYRAAVARLKSSRVRFAEMAELRHVTALKKVKHIVDLAAETVDSSGNCFVCGHHTDVIAGIVSGLRRRGIVTESITGQTPMALRQAYVDRFQAKEIQCIVGSTRACGVGLTLTSTSQVIFAELDWSPSAISQAEDRTHRIGQKNAVLSRLCVFEGSVDARIATRIVEKEEVIESIMDYAVENEEEENTLNNLSQGVDRSKLPCFNDCTTKTNERVPMGIDAKQGGLPV